MRRVVFAMRPGEIGHLNTSLYLARQLQARGCDVWYAADGPDAEYLGRQGFPCVPSPADMPLTDASTGGALSQRFGAWLHVLRADLRSLSILRDLLAAGSDSVADLTPALVIADEGVWWLPVVASMRGLKVAYLATTLPGRGDPAQPARKGVTPLFASLARVAHRAIYYAAAVWRGISPLQLVLSKRISPGVLKDVWDCWDYRCAVPRLVACPVEFDHPENPRPPDVRFIEPCVDRGRTAQQTHQSFPEPAHVRILVSMGSSRQPGLDRFLEALRQVALANPDWSFAVGSGGDDDVRLDGPSAENFRVYPYLDQLQLLQGADLLISHCGLNSVKEAILAGVPILGFPIRRDQPGVAARVVRHRLGMTGDFRSVTPALLESMIRDVTTSADYALKVKRLSARFAETEAQAPGLRELERLIGGLR